jgi:hypothetical protein
VGPLNVLSLVFLSNNLKLEIYKTVILPVVLYGCETKGRVYRLGIFENTVLRRIFGNMKEENGENCTVITS